MLGRVTRHRSINLKTIPWVRHSRTRDAVGSRVWRGEGVEQVSWETTVDQRPATGRWMHVDSTNTDAAGLIMSFISVENRNIISTNYHSAIAVHVSVNYQHMTHLIKNFFQFLVLFNAAFFASSAMPQAIERLLATPMIKPFFPARIVMLYWLVS